MDPPSALSDRPNQSSIAIPPPKVSSAPVARRSPLAPASTTKGNRTISSSGWRLFFTGYICGIVSLSLFKGRQTEFACLPTGESNAEAGSAWGSALKKWDTEDAVINSSLAKSDETTHSNGQLHHSFSWEDVYLSFQPEFTKTKWDLLLLTNEDLARDPPIPDIAKADNEVKASVARVHQKGFYKDYVIGIRHLWIAGMWGQNPNHECPDFDELHNYTRQKSKSKIVYNVVYNSAGMFGNGNIGQGNWITSFYDMRLKALESGVNLSITADDAEESKTLHILPWLNGYFPARYTNTTTANPIQFPYPYQRPKKFPEDLHFGGGECGGSYFDTRISLMVPMMIHDFRKLAISIAGIPEGHPSEAWAETNLWSRSNLPSDYMDDIMQLPNPKRGDKPLVPGLDLDETALHFRCEDLMSTRHPSFSFLKFSAYSRRIDPTTKSIGIVTNPFDDKAQNRPSRGKRSDAKAACQGVAVALKEHLTETFPDATVSIRNGVNETVITSYTRLIMATRTIVGLSSFGVFTAVANFGNGYIQKPVRVSFIIHIQLYHTSLNLLSFYFTSKGI